MIQTNRLRLIYHKEHRLNNQLKAAWTQHLSGEKEKEEFRQVLYNSQYTFRRLKDILAEKKRELEAGEITLSDFDSPCWAEKQAFRNGQRSLYKFVEDLLNFVK